MTETSTERLSQYANYKKISISAFEKSIGKAPSYLRNSKEVTSGVLQKIMKVYPDLSIDWIITGEGQMLKSDMQPSTIGNGNIVGNTANNSSIISTNANGNFNNVQTSIGGDSKKTEKETNKLKLEISKLKAEIERLNEKNSHLMENMQVKDDLIASLKAMIEVLQGK